MDISAIFKRAWEITWKHKGLWLVASGHPGQLL